MTLQRRTIHFLTINLFALALLHAGLSTPTILARQTPSAPSAQPAQSSDDDAPFTKSWILYMLRPTGLDAGEIVRRVEQRGVAFRVSAKDEEELRAAGATPAVIEAARGNYRGPLNRKELEGVLRPTRPGVERPTASDVIVEIKKRGVSFKLTPQDAAALEKAGASKDVIVAAQDNYRSEEMASTPRLPLAPTITVDPSIMPPDLHPIITVDPKSYTQSSAGQGGGMGTGSGVGMGTGEGVGPGRGGNTGGGDPYPGGGGPGNTGPVDYTRPFKSSEVTRKALITEKPEPSFTKEAEKNNTSGIVRLRAVLHFSGKVTNISVVKGLPDGLTEKAIKVARQIKFKPAEKDGHKVSQYVVLEYNFNWY
jgi:TonB family protein